MLCGPFELSGTKLSASYKASDFCWQIAPAFLQHLRLCHISAKFSWWYFQMPCKVFCNHDDNNDVVSAISSPLTLLPSEKQMGTSKESRLFSVIKSTSSFFARFFFFFLTLSAQRRPIFRAPSSSVEFFDTSIDLKKRSRLYLFVFESSQKFRDQRLAIEVIDMSQTRDRNGECQKWLIGTLKKHVKATRGVT